MKTTKDRTDQTKRYVVLEVSYSGLSPMQKTEENLNELAKSGYRVITMVRMWNDRSAIILERKRRSWFRP